MMLAFSACGTFLIHSGFKSAREKDIQNGYNNASVVCINLVQNVKRTINLVYRDTGYEKQKNVVVRQAAQSVSVRNAGEEVQFALWTERKDKNLQYEWTQGGRRVNLPGRSRSRAGRL